MKKLTLCFILTCIILTGCANEDRYIPVKEDSNTRFRMTGNQYIIDTYYWDEYIDTETNNLYLYNGSQYSNGFVPLYDENGNIAKYEG